MATKEQIAKLMADQPETIVARLNGTYIYPGAVSPMRQSPLCEEAAREILRLRALLKETKSPKVKPASPPRQEYESDIDGDEFL